MAPLRAVLLFPLRPAAAADALAHAPRAAAPALAPPLALSLYLAARGCAVADAAVTGAAALVLLAGLGLGGALAAAAARRLVPGAPRRRASVSFVFAAWACTLFAVLLIIGRIAGLGAATPFASGLALLVWGVVAGTRLVAGESEVEPGRALVAACAGASGAVIGLLLTGYLVHAQLVMTIPAPVAVAGGSPGDPLLVRRERATAPGNIAVARDGRIPRIFLARTHPGGRLELLGPPDSGPVEKSHVLGRVFFRFGGPWGGESLR